MTGKENPNYIATTDLGIGDAFSIAILLLQSTVLVISLLCLVFMTCGICK